MRAADPSICTNIFAIFHCFTVGVDASGAEVAYVMADFRYQCTGVMHYSAGGAHPWVIKSFSSDPTCVLCIEHLECDHN